MKIVLSKDDVVRLICKELHIEATELVDGKVWPEKDYIYWEGNPEKQEER